LSERRPLVGVSDSVFPNLEPAREQVSRIGAELRLAEKPTPEAILQAAREADGLLVTYAKITSDLIDQMPRCRILARFGIGVDNIDVPAATKAGIVVTNVPDYCLDEVSDHALALLLALARKITLANSRAHAGHWELPPLVPIGRLRGSVLGLAGFGRIPQHLAPKAKALGMRVVASDPYLSKEAMAGHDAEKVEFSELVKISDFISVHAPLVPETQGLFNAAIFAQMKPTAYLVNTARGPLVDIAALVQALDRGQLAGAALDVLPEEPPKNSPLFGRDNVILTPHMSFYSVESLVELQTKAAQDVVRVLSGEPPRNPINREVLQPGKQRTISAA
jgi:D-3-phosphoglycerate dehydrogenase / 2-oxoglutarate reductase